MIEEFLSEHIVVIEALKEQESTIKEIADVCIMALKSGKKILLCGNGGSAGDAQHISAELTGRYKTERKALPAIALTTDTSALTAIGNDYGYDRVFDRQVEALGVMGDVLIGISTSGNSKNIINAFEVGKKLGLVCIALSGRDGGAMNGCSDINLVIPSFNTPRIQESHILVGHIICEFIDKAFE